jgi:hypothetical protein
MAKEYAHGGVGGFFAPLKIDDRERVGHMHCTHHMGVEVYGNCIYAHVRVFAVD